MLSGGSTASELDTLYNPSLAAEVCVRQGTNSGDTVLFVVWADTADYRSICRRVSRWKYDYRPDMPPAEADGIGRRLAREVNGATHWCGSIDGNVAAGPVIGSVCLPVLAGAGGTSALSLDGSGREWAAYVRDDTVWCKMGEYGYRACFAGGSSAVPGQPSIVCYSNQAGGAYVASVVFPVYDTAGTASRIMYARVDTAAVVLDTIESVANLGDSLPSISVYATDTLLVTFQHGDSVLSAMLADYGPGTLGQPPAWSSPSLVTANGYHPMNVMEDGSVLNCVWTQKSGNNYAIQRATNDLGGGMFESWTGMADPSYSDTIEKANAVYAGVGVTVYQAKDANGKWIIKGYVRGEETTFVANDTDAYHPHAVAESSAVSPSIDQVRVHLLYTAGVAFEVDSGVYDTGETRYKCESLNVSHAGSDATKCNNGSKLLRSSSDSIFCVYSDLDNAVMYARSAAGDSWQREIMTTGRDYPAIAEDSSGRRWVVVRRVEDGQSQTPMVQEAYYRDDTSWVGPETLYTNAQYGTLGPASLSGASDTATGIVYAAFLASGATSQCVILAKFNGSVVSTYTVATGSSLGDPSVAVEAYLADSDRVHVSWEEDGIIKYCMNTDGRSSSIANNWTSTVSLSDPEVVSQHSCINADRDQIVAAWAQGDTTDIYCRKRSTDSAYNNWESAANLSNTASNASDWPVIAVGDTVVVAWEETRSTSDHDILACIDFDDTLNVADNATVSGYPHVLFYNKASGDTAIPYLHTIWSEAPEARYYEVGYNKLNLKQATGGGQQSAGSTPIPAKPALAACRPNPLRDRTQISYALSTGSNVSLRVYDVSGRSVRTLASGFQKPGSYSVTWDSKDSRGRLVPHGVYFIQLRTPAVTDEEKIVVAR